jgi:hypothetical protein
MKSLFAAKIEQEQEQERPFIVLNENAQVYSGLRRGTPYFSDNFDDARSLSNDRQLNMIQRGTYFKLEKHYV